MARLASSRPSRWRCAPAVTLSPAKEHNVPRPVTTPVFAGLFLVSTASFRGVTRCAACAMRRATMHAQPLQQLVPFDVQHCARPFMKCCPFVLHFAWRRSAALRRQLRNACIARFAGRLHAENATANEVQGSTLVEAPHNAERAKRSGASPHLGIKMKFMRRIDLRKVRHVLVKDV